MKNKYRLALFVLLAMIVGFAGSGQAGAAGAPVPVPLTEGTATYSQEVYCCNLNVDEAVDGQLYDYGASGTYNGWAIYDGSSDAQTAVWETTSDINATQLDFALYHTWGSSSNLGRFRLSYTTDDRNTFADGLNTGGDVAANWTVLTGAAFSGTGGENFTILPDNSILVSGNNPATTVYSVSFAGSFNGITGIRLEALADASLPDDGPSRGGNGNFHLVEITLDATLPPGPLDDGDWELVAHMSNTGGMFDGNGDLSPTYSDGTFVANPDPSTPDFQRVFPVAADEILFITGDRSIWAVADYGDLRTLIDAQGGVFSQNLAFETGVYGVVSNTMGNVLSRGAAEDPWISMDGGHSAGVSNQWIVWGEANYPGPNHVALKNLHDGINVYVRVVNEPPTADPGGPYIGDEGAVIPLDGTNSDDPDFDALTYSWTVNSPLCSLTNANTATPDLTCTDNVDTFVVLTVDDGNGGTDSASIDVKVKNVAPDVTAAAGQNGIEDTYTSFALATFSDDGVPDTHTATVDWGDGSAVEGTAVDQVADSVSGSHTYDAPGSYTVIVTVTDDDTGSNSASLVINVANGQFRYCGYAQAEVLTAEEDANIDCSVASELKTEIKKKVTVGGDVTSFKKGIVLGEDAFVGGDATARRKVKLESGADVQGTIEQRETNFSPPQPTDLSVSVSAGGNDVKVEKGDSESPAPGSHGKLLVEEDGTLNLSDGAYAFEEIEVKKNATINIDLAGGAGTLVVRVEGKLMMEEGTEMFLTNGGSAEDVLFVIAGDSVELKKEGTYLGTFVAPAAEIQVEEKSTLEGAVFGEKVVLKKEVILSGAPAADLFAEQFIP